MITKDQPDKEVPVLTKTQVHSAEISPAHKAKVAQIVAFVQETRKRDGTVPTQEKPHELSGIANGEGFVHLNALLSSDFQENWTSLLDPQWGEGQCDDVIAAFSRLTPRT